jgi:hypothetical protein
MDDRRFELRYVERFSMPLETFFTPPDFVNDQPSGHLDGLMNIIAKAFQFGSRLPGQIRNGGLNQPHVGF